MSEPPSPDEAGLLSSLADFERPGDMIALSNGLMSRVHLQGTCADTAACWVHRPSTHALNSAPVEARISATSGRLLVYRICPHDGRHPDPDDRTYRTRYSTKHAAWTDTDGEQFHTCCPFECCENSDA